ncbi:MAG: hypothetical protein SF162_11905 [bacterium]|nr:hypothetical protein [bacterium]
MSSRKPSIGQVVRAFIKAVRMTLRGESVQTPGQRAAARFPRLTDWMNTTLKLLDQIDQAASAFDLTAIPVKVDKREMSLRTLLNGVRYHATQEYPYLLQHEMQYSAMGVNALNLNDRHMIAQTLQAPGLPTPLKPLIEALAAHLAQIPTDPPPAPADHQKH